MERLERPRQERQAPIFWCRLGVQQHNEYLMDVSETRVVQKVCVMVVLLCVALYAGALSINVVVPRLEIEFPGNHFTP